MVSREEELERLFSDVSLKFQKDPNSVKARVQELTTQLVIIITSFDEKRQL